MKQILNKKNYYLLVQSTKNHKHKILKDIPDKIYYFINGIFIFLLLSIICFISISFQFQIWEVKRLHIEYMKNIDDMFTQKGFSYEERQWIYKRNGDMTDWSQCIFISPWGHLFNIIYLRVLLIVLEDKDNYARQIYDYALESKGKLKKFLIE